MDCEFCQIAAGARAADVVHESRTTIAFLDRDPAARGHTLLVPRRHVPTLLHLPDGAAGSFFASLMEVIQRLTETLHPAGLEVGWTQGTAGGRYVSHLHARLVPRFRYDLSGIHALGEGVYREHLAEIAAIIRRERVEPRRGGPSRLVPRRMAARGGGDGDP
jgi:histidine triad (HIT) family protein